MTLSYLRRIVRQMSHSDEIQRFVVNWQAHYLLDLFVMEGADGYCSQVQRHSLQQEVLGRVASLQLDVAGASLRAILLGRTFVHGRHYKHRWRKTHGSLVQGGIRQTPSDILAAQHL